MELKNGFDDLKATMMRSGVLPEASPERLVYLHPGQIHVSQQATSVSTILGSCVAVCLWDTRVGVGGMVHYLLPESSGTPSSPMRYGDVAVPKLITELTRMGGKTSSMRARVYGGACVLKAFQKSESSGVHLGERNVQIAKDALRSANITVVDEDTMGDATRKILFETATGKATVKLVHRHVD